MLYGNVKYMVASDRNVWEHVLPNNIIASVGKHLFTKHTECLHIATKHYELTTKQLSYEAYS